MPDAGTVRANGVRPNGRRDDESFSIVNDERRERIGWAFYDCLFAFNQV